MNDEFDKWNNLKKKINSNNKINKFPKESEVWICQLGKNIGFEQNGIGNEFVRPVLIVKKFNNKIFWAIPLSSKQKMYDFYFNFTDRDNKKVSLILAQMKLISINRLERKIYEFENKSFAEVKKQLKSFL